MALDKTVTEYSEAVVEKRGHDLHRQFVVDHLDQKTKELSRRGMFFSGQRIRLVAEAHSQVAEHLLRARLDSMLEGCSKAAIPLTAEIFKEILLQLQEDYKRLFKSLESTLRRVVDTFERPEKLRESISGLVEEKMFHVWDRILAEWKIRRAGALLDSQAKSGQDTLPQLGNVVNIYYNVTGANARINIDSADQSVNIQNVSQAELFQSLRETANRDVSADGLAEVLERIDALEKAVGTRDALAAYQRLIATVADHITILQPFLPALTLLVSGQAS